MPALRLDAEAAWQERGNDAAHRPRSWTMQYRKRAATIDNE
ncbi:hypothetical protein BSLA_01f0180 [Burkholderia stabilis]|nr:hypothetical protein BSLA_01f0180 [Burkholderia stabilis]